MRALLNRSETISSRIVNQNLVNETPQSRNDARAPAKNVRIMHTVVVKKWD